HAASLALLAAGRGHAGDIRNAYSHCESLVHSQVGALKGPGVGGFGCRSEKHQASAVTSLPPERRFLTTPQEIQLCKPAHSRRKSCPFDLGQAGGPQAAYAESLSRQSGRGYAARD